MTGVEFPKYPIPDLDKTCDDFLAAVETFTPDMGSARALVKELRGRKDIISVIEDRYEKEDNWVTDWWLSDMYLNVPIPLPVNSSPGWVFPRRDFPRGMQDVTRFMTGFILGIKAFKETLENDSLEPELATSKVSRQYLCMKQYNRILNFYRRPGLEGDSHVDVLSDKVRDEESVIIMIKSLIYKLPVKTKGQWKRPAEIQTGLMSIYEVSKLEEDPKYKIPLLTSADRSSWGRIHREMKENNENAKNFRDIEESLFVFCIDEPLQNLTDRDISQKEMFRQTLTGGGPSKNGGNRWFDKTLQVMVSMNGVNGLCMEHSAAEGVAVVNTVNKILLDLESFLEDLDEIDPLLTIDVDGPMNWNLNDNQKECILTANKEFEKLDKDTDIEIFRFLDYGKTFIKACNCSPDAFLQMALQLTYYRLHDRLCPTYESASTRRFIDGRVDCIRSSHPEALSWVKSMTNPQANKEAKVSGFRSAVARQTEVMLANINGHGVDLPMLGLKNASEILFKRENTSAPQLFQKDIYKRSNLFQLTTSQVPISLPYSYIGYGPVVPDGYGVAYNIQKDHIIAVVSSFFSCPLTNSAKFCEAFSESLSEIKALFD